MLCCAATLGSKILSTRLKASVAAEAAADDAYRSTERQVAARMMILEGVPVLEDQVSQKGNGMSRRVLMRKI